MPVKRRKRVVKNVPRRATARRPRKNGGWGRGLEDVAKAIASNPFAQEIGKRMITKGINYLPTLFKKGTKRIKNKHLRNIAQSDIAEEIVNRGTNRLLCSSKDLVGGL